VLLADDHDGPGVWSAAEEHDFKVVAAVGDGWRLVGRPSGSGRK
jgi:hypothetical protein